MVDRQIVFKCMSLFYSVDLTSTYNIPTPPEEKGTKEGRS